MPRYKSLLGYHFTRKLWNQRFGYCTRAKMDVTPYVRIYDPRAFGEYKLGKGFSPCLESETMNTGIPPQYL